MNDTKKKTKKKIVKLRTLENYPKLQKQLDEMYKMSKEGIKFHSLMRLITCKDNILLAIDTIRRNKGKNTPGTNKTVMSDILEKPLTEIVNYIRERLNWYEPQTIRRKYIPKSDGKKRPLGIPTMEERLIQQCILQIIEPIVETKFSKASFGFRPHKNAHQAWQKIHHRLCSTKLQYMVDLDIKGFFDNVNHSKLIKQLYTIGIQDKKLLSIIKEMLKAKIVEPKFGKNYEVTLNKGTPQGGILSPLLANVVLNEFDQWIMSQWEEVKTRKKFKTEKSKRPCMNKTKLKRLIYVRYADDFRILTLNETQATKIFHASKQWLEKRLHLEISEEKSKITNLLKKNGEFLGMQVKLVPNSKKYETGNSTQRFEYLPATSLTDKVIERIGDNIRERIKAIKYTFDPDSRVRKILDYNAYIRGLQYYSVVSKWSKISSRLTWDTRKITYNRLRRIYKTRKLKRDKTVEVGKFSRKKNAYSVNGIQLEKPSDVKHIDLPKISPEKLCKYTPEGRKLVHDLRRKNLDDLMEYLRDRIDGRQSVAHQINAVSRLAMQQGICPITGVRLRVGFMRIHHIVPVKDKGTDEILNLLVTFTWVHDLIHLVDKAKIKEKYKELQNALTRIEKPKKFLENLNKYREKVGNGKLRIKDLTA